MGEEINKEKNKNKLKRKKIFKAIGLSFLVVFLLFCLFLERRPAGTVKNPQFGQTFSKVFAQDLGLEWKKAYIAILDDLQPKSVKIPVYWQDVEYRRGKYRFDDYDWMVDEAKERGIGVILVVGRKVPRWPECHAPQWANNDAPADRRESLLGYIKRTADHYDKQENLEMWQVDNEPYLPFGECPDAFSEEFLKREIETVRSKDPNHKIMITDSGELSIWVDAARLGDVFGTTMYRVIWHKSVGYLKYPLPPVFFWLKANIVHLFYPGKPIIGSELQGEPWGPKLIPNSTLEEQFKSMDLEQFRENIAYAKKVGLPQNYMWGSEWWYWLKTTQNHPEFWEEVQKLSWPQEYNQ
jgi:hypothetical protein